MFFKRRYKLPLLLTGLENTYSNLKKLVELTCNFGKMVGCKIKINSFFLFTIYLKSYKIYKHYTMLKNILTRNKWILWETILLMGTDQNI